MLSHRVVVVVAAPVCYQQEAPLGTISFIYSPDALLILFFF